MGVTPYLSMSYGSKTFFTSPAGPLRLRRIDSVLNQNYLTALQRATWCQNDRSRRTCGMTRWQVRRAGGQAGSDVRKSQKVGRKVAESEGGGSKMPTFPRGPASKYNGVTQTLRIFVYDFTNRTFSTSSFSVRLRVLRRGREHTSGVVVHVRHHWNINYLVIWKNLYLTRCLSKRSVSLAWRKLPKQPKKWKRQWWWPTRWAWLTACLYLKCPSSRRRSRTYCTYCKRARPSKIWAASFLRVCVGFASVLKKIVAL